MPIGAAAIRFVLRHPAVTAAVVGVRNATEVTQNVSYLAAAVPAELFGELAPQAGQDACGGGHCGDSDEPAELPRPHGGAGIPLSN